MKSQKKFSDNHLRILDCFLSCGANIESKAKDDYTTLLTALQEGNLLV